MESSINLPPFILAVHIFIPLFHIMIIIYHQFDFCNKKTLPIFICNHKEFPIEFCIGKLTND